MSDTPKSKVSRDLDRRLAKSRGAVPRAARPTAPPTETAKPVFEARHRYAKSDRRSLMVPVAEVADDPLQPRAAFPDFGVRELAEDIRKNGLQEPILVRDALPHDRNHGILTPYVVVFGHRRCAAVRMLAHTEVEAFFFERLHVGESDADYLARARTLQNSENEAREDVTPLDLALAFGKRVASGMSKTDAARSLDRSPSWGTHAMKIAEPLLADAVQQRQFLDAYRRLYLELGRPRAFESIAWFFTTELDPFGAMQVAATKLDTVRRDVRNKIVDEWTELDTEGNGLDSAEVDAAMRAEMASIAPDPIPSRREKRQQAQHIPSTGPTGAEKSAGGLKGRPRHWRISFTGKSTPAPVRELVQSVVFRRPLEQIDRAELETILDALRAAVLNAYDTGNKPKSSSPPSPKK